MPKIKTLYIFVIAAIIALISHTDHESIFAHDWVAPKEDVSKPNPVVMDAASIKTGKKAFELNCSSCHGSDAGGLDKASAGLKKSTPNLLVRLRNHSEGDFHWKIRTGKNEMPAFEKDLSETEIWHIINYLKSENDK